MDQIAPPYSETDTFSNTNTKVLMPTTTEADNVSRAAGRLRSNTSSTENSLIYTHYSQTGPGHQHFENSFEHQFAMVTSSHARYPGNSQLKALLNIRFMSRRKVFQKMSTFHLLRQTMDLHNEAELIDEDIHGLTLNEDDHSRLDINDVQAHLSPLRQSIASPNADWAKLVDEVTGVWNDGFFVPRGLKSVRIDMGHSEFWERANSIPGAWTTDGEEPSNFSERSKVRRCMLNRCSPCHKQSQGCRIGSMVANDDGFTIGKNGLVASSNGFRVGKMFVAGHKGLRVGGSRDFLADEYGASIGGCRFGGRRGWHS